MENLWAQRVYKNEKCSVNRGPRRGGGASCSDHFDDLLACGSGRGVQKFRLKWNVALAPFVNFHAPGNNRVI